MRGLFFIVRGQYSKGAEPSFVNSVTGDVNYIGGYDPYGEDTPNWYMLLDKETFNCVACGSDFDKVVKGVYRVIKNYKGVAKNYFRHISKVTSDDYYETHYLGRKPLNHDQRVKKAEGRCPRVSPAMMELYKHIYEEFGDYYEEEVQVMERLAYDELEEGKMQNKAKKLVSKVSKNKLSMSGKVQQPKGEVKEIVKPTLKKVIPKTRIGLNKV